jgi:ABC-type antimicrobial peptide transport system permease subunit
MAISEKVAPERRKTASLAADALYRLVRNKAAVVGGSMVILLALTAIFAAYVAP